MPDISFFSPSYLDGPSLTMTSYLVFSSSTSSVSTGSSSTNHPSSPTASTFRPPTPEYPRPRDSIATSNAPTLIHDEPAKVELTSTRHEEVHVVPVVQAPPIAHDEAPIQAHRAEPTVTDAQPSHLPPAPAMGATHGTSAASQQQSRETIGRSANAYGQGYAFS